MSIFGSILSGLSFLTEILGSIILVIIILSVILIAIALVLLAYSFKTGKVPFPNLIILTVIFFEGPIKAIMRLGGVDDTAIDQLSIDLQNRAMWPTYISVPYNKRAIFIPQCLRSVNCQARLSPEGIKCMDCGGCEIAKAKKEAEKLGYLFFVVPGSSFIARMTRKYCPEAIIGVGCMSEVKEGLDLMHKHKLPAVGVVLTTAGCVGTILDWDKFYEVMRAVEDKAAPKT
jgi:uncharacterized protein